MKASAWFPALSFREQRVYAIAMHEKVAPAIIDVSQNPGCTRTVEREKSAPLCTRAILPNSSLFMVDSALPIRPLVGRECLTLMGFPWQQQPHLLRRQKGAGEEFSDSFLMDLSGNAFGGNVVLAIILSAMLCISWKPTGDTSEPDLVEELAHQAGVKDLNERGSSASADEGSDPECMQDVLEYLGVTRSKARRVS